MSRLAKKPVVLPSGVEYSRKGTTVTVKGPKGTLEQFVHECIQFEEDADKREIMVVRTDDEKQTRAYHGLYWSLLRNMVIGVSEGYSKTLEIQGVGFRAQMQGKKLSLSVGFCHTVDFDIPEGLVVECPQPVLIRVTGIDKQLVGEFTAVVRRVRPPEPYKGKGIRYQGENVRRLPGKAFAGAK